MGRDCNLINEERKQRVDRAMQSANERWRVKSGRWLVRTGLSEWDGPERAFGPVAWVKRQRTLRIPSKGLPALGQLPPGMGNSRLWARKIFAAGPNSASPWFISLALVLPREATCLLWPLEALSHRQSSRPSLLAPLIARSGFSFLPDSWLHLF